MGAGPRPRRMSADEARTADARVARAGDDQLHGARPWRRQAASASARRAQCRRSSAHEPLLRYPARRRCRQPRDRPGAAVAAGTQPCAGACSTTLTGATSPALCVAAGVADAALPHPAHGAGDRRGRDGACRASRAYSSDTVRFLQAAIRPAPRRPGQAAAVAGHLASASAGQIRRQWQPARVAASCRGVPTPIHSLCSGLSARCPQRSGAWPLAQRRQRAKAAHGRDTCPREPYGVAPARTADFRTQPHNLEAEQALLGAILVNNEAYHRVSDFLLRRAFLRAGACAHLRALRRADRPRPARRSGHAQALFEEDPAFEELDGARYLVASRGRRDDHQRGRVCAFSSTTWRSSAA